MTRTLLAIIVSLLLSTTASAMDPWIQRITIDADDSDAGYAGAFYDALIAAFLNAGESEWGPGENPVGWESPDPDEITIEPGDLLPGPTDNGNCTDWYWEVPETRGCG
jgi:hypothetical protein